MPEEAHAISVSFRAIEAALDEHGLAARGGFVPSPQDMVPEAGGKYAAAVVLIGNVGPKLWLHFAPHAGEGQHSLDDWTRAVVEPIAARFSARAVYPFDKPPSPFQRWAMKAEPVKPSPLGVLIHPDYGLWHAYRAALVFSVPVDLPKPADRARPCDSCVDKPCLSACPVGAFHGAGYDVPACAAHLGSGNASDCFDAGCLARAACPVGTPYLREQSRFHMRAFHRAVCR